LRERHPRPAQAVRPAGVAAPLVRRAGAKKFDVAGALKTASLRGHRIVASRHTGRCQCVKSRAIVDCRSRPRAVAVRANANEGYAGIGHRRRAYPAHAVAPV